jgi:hypothetical protein
MYIRVNDAMRMECGNRWDWDVGVLAMTLSKLSPNTSSTDFGTHTEHCLPICTNQATRSLLLNAMPTLHDIDIAMRQRGDVPHGNKILGTDATGGQRGTETSTGPSKGKEKAASSVDSGDEVLSDDDIPL